MAGRVLQYLKSEVADKVLHYLKSELTDWDIAVSLASSGADYLLQHRV